MLRLGGMWDLNERGSPWWRTAVRGLVIAFGVVMAAHVSSGISYHGEGSLGPHGLVTLALVVLVLSVFNAVLKPLLVLFTLPFVLLTLGLGLWIINALLFLLAGKIVPGFEVAGFGSALVGALIVSLVSLLVNRLLGKRAMPPRVRVLGGTFGQSPAARRDNDVIDV